MCPGEMWTLYRTEVVQRPAPAVAASLNFVAQFIWTARGGVCVMAMGKLWWILYLSGNHIGNIDPKQEHVQDIFFSGSRIVQFVFHLTPRARGEGSRKTTCGFLQVVNTVKCRILHF